MYTRLTINKQTNERGFLQKQKRVEEKGVMMSADDDDIQCQTGENRVQVVSGDVCALGRLMSVLWRCSDCVVDFLCKCQCFPLSLSHQTCILGTLFSRSSSSSSGGSYIFQHVKNLFEKSPRVSFWMCAVVVRRWQLFGRLR